MGRPFSVFDKDGRRIEVPGAKIIIPFDNESAHAARQEIFVNSYDGLPPGFARIALHLVAGEVVTDDPQDG